MKPEYIAFIISVAALAVAVWLILSGFDRAQKQQQIQQLRRKRRTHINARAPEHGFIFAPGQAIQMNAEALPEVIQIAPFGRWPTRDKKAVQVFNAESAEQIISWFNFWPRRIARLARLNAIKVWVGHPDFDSSEWPERIELGSIVELNADEHGLNARVEWNAEALAHVTKHKFPSVAWDCEINADGTETPAMLWSVGMWHKPNIKSVRPVINAAAEDPETDPEDPQDPTQTPPQTNMLTKIMEALKAAGIVRDDDAEETILGAIGSLIQSLAWKREEEKRNADLAAEMRTALNAIADVKDVQDDGIAPILVTQLNAVITERDTQAATVTQLNAQVTQLTANFAAERAARINAVIERAIEKGLASKADAERLQTELNADFDTALAKLTEATPRLNAKPLSLGGFKPQIMEAVERRTQLNAWVNERMEKTGCDYDTAWNASKTDPATKGIHDAITAANANRSTQD